MPTIATNNIGRLKNELERNNWHLTAFEFEYNGNRFDVIFENADNLLQKRNKYASVLLTFIDIDNPIRKLSVEANQVGILCDAKTLRIFFGIKYAENLGDILKQFYQRFVSFVPASIPPLLNPRQNAEIDACLASRGGHNPNAIYCYDARRLGVRDGRQMHRSIYIENLIRRRRPSLYKYFEKEDTVTFYFSDSPKDELSDLEIIKRFVQRESLNS